MTASHFSPRRSCHFRAVHAAGSATPPRSNTVQFSSRPRSITGVQRPLAAHFASSMSVPRRAARSTRHAHGVADHVLVVEVAAVPRATPDGSSSSEQSRAPGASHALAPPSSLQSSSRCCAPGTAGGGDASLAAHTNELPNTSPSVQPSSEHVAALRAAGAARGPPPTVSAKMSSERTRFADSAGVGVVSTTATSAQQQQQRLHISPSTHSVALRSAACRCSSSAHGPFTFA